MNRMNAYSKRLLKKLPLVASYLQRRHQRSRFSVERSLINGTHHNENRHPSIIHFSVHKSATQYTKNILRRCASQNGMVPVGVPDYAFHTDFPYLDRLSATEMRKYQHIFKPTGYLYSFFGGMIEGIPALEAYKVLLMVRDPRDALVSHYYSLAYSHPAPEPESGKYAEFMNVREMARRLSVDEYVLARSDGVYGTLDRYRKLLLEKYPNTYVTRYEEMTADFETWLNRLLNACRLIITDELRQSLLDENARLKPKGEDVHRHIRKGRPGDFREKLRAETIDQLNAKFGPTLEIFGYAWEGLRR